MKKDREVKVVDSREAEADLTMEMVDLTILCKTKANMNGEVRKKENMNEKMKTKARLGGNVVIHIEVETIPIEEEVVLTLEVDLKVKCYRCACEGHRSFECKIYGDIVGRNVVIQGESNQP